MKPRVIIHSGDELVRGLLPRLAAHEVETVVAIIPKHMCASQELITCDIDFAPIELRMLASMRASSFVARPPGLLRYKTILAIVAVTRGAR